MAFQRRKFVLVSFSDGGEPREVLLLKVDEDAKVEGEFWVDRVLMVESIRAVEVEAMVEAAVLALVPHMISLSG